MTEIRSKKAEKTCHLLKVTVIVLLTLLMLVSTVGAAPSNITFVTAGASFSPIITVTGNPTIQWVFGDGSTSSSASPTVRFGSPGRRVNTLVVTPWSAVTKINLGYDGSDEGPATIANLSQQNVVSVSGLENVAPYLQVWASSYNPITELDFTDFTSLQVIECFYCRLLSTMKLRNVPSLTRLAFERSNISYLDLSEAPSLTDLRGARQGGTTYIINWGNTGSRIWHICTRDNPQIPINFPYNQYPALEELFNWNDNQTGTLYLTSTSLREVLSANNHYSAAVLSGCFPAAGGNGVVDISKNELTSLDISNDPGLLNLNASFNLLNQTEVDGILQTLDSFKTRDGDLDLTGNAAPSTIGTAYANNLTARGWSVRVSSKINQPIANFTSSITFGTAPLVVQFKDTSTNNPVTRLWDFGDGIYSTVEFPEHVYYSPGNYTVTLGVKNADGSDSKVVVITVLEQPFIPLANFSSNVTEGYAPLSVQFNDSSANATSWYWEFGDGNNSNEVNPVHIYSVSGSYIVNLTVGKANGNNSKTGTINVLENNSSDSGNNGGNGDGSSGGSSDGNSGGSSTSSSSSGSGGGGGAGGSPELQSNVEIKELSQAFISSGQNAKFEFPQKVTPVVSVSFDSKKTAGKTTTIVEMLKAKSTLASEPPSNEIYKFINIWVGNSGFATPRNIENAVVSFKVEKSWIQDKKIDKSSITLNRYSDKAWNQLPTNLSSEDNSYLYFTAQTPGFSPFAITGKTTASMTVQPLSGNKTQPELSKETQTKTNTESTTGKTQLTPEQTQKSNISGKESMETPIIIIGLVVVCLLGLFLWYRR